MTRTALLADLQREQEQWEALLAQIGEERMDQPGVAGEWSIKDIVAHLTGWRRRTVARLQAGLRGEPEPAPPWPPELQTDEINAWLYQTNHDRSVHDVLADSRQVFQQLVDTIAAFPEPALLDPTRFGFEWVEDEPLTAAAFFAHLHEEHEPDIRAWLARQDRAAAHGDTSVVTTLFAHNTWANLKLLDYCEHLSDAQLDATAIGCYGSIRDTLVHIVGAEVSYVERVNGKRPPHMLAGDLFPGFAVLKDVVRWAGDELLQLARSARKETIVREREHGLGCEYPLASLMVQEVTHATEHRTQIAAILTQLDMEPPDMSVWTYMVEIGEFQEFADGT